MICPNCKNEIPDKCKICDYCGTEITAVKETKAKSLSKITSFVKTRLLSLKDFYQKKKKICNISIAGLFILIAIICSLFIFGNNNPAGFASKLSDSALCIKDGSLYCLSCETGDSITLFSGKISDTDAPLYTLETVKISTVGNKILFYKNLKHEPDSDKLYGDLCIRPLKNTTSSHSVIDTDVTDCELLETSKKLSAVLYEKDDFLYEYNTKNKKITKLSSVNSLSDVKCISSDTYAYLSSDGELFIKSPGKPETLVSENAVNFYPNGHSRSLCYEKESNMELSFELSEYVEFDVDETSPVKKPKYPSKKGLSKEEYKKEYEKWSEEYNEYLDKIAAEDKIKTIVSEIKGAIYTPELPAGNEIYEYNISDGTSNLISEYANAVLTKNGLLFLNILNPIIDGKVKLSQISSADDVKAYIDNSLTFSYFISTESGIREIDIADEAVIVNTNNDNTKLLYLVPSENEETTILSGELYSANLFEDLSSPALIDSDVIFASVKGKDGKDYDLSPGFDGEEIFYYKDYSYDTLDFYTNGKLIYQDALPGHVKNGKTSTLAFLKRAIFEDNGEMTASLVILKDGKESEVIKGKIHSFNLLDDDTLVYCVKSDKNTYDLYSYKTKRPKLICENVSEAVCSNTAFFSPDSRKVLLYTKNKTLYTLKKGKGVKTDTRITHISVN